MGWDMAVVRNLLKSHLSGSGSISMMPLRPDYITSLKQHQMKQRGRCLVYSACLYLMPEENSRAHLGAGQACISFISDMIFFSVAAAFLIVQCRPKGNITHRRVDGQ